MGFSLEIATDSEDVLSAAAEVWLRFPRTSRARGVTLRVNVTGASTVAPRPCPPRGRDHLVSIVQSPENFAVADLARGFSFAWLSADVAANHSYSRYYFLEPLVYLMIEARYLAPVHASCVALGEQAVLLCGSSGAGKTSVAFACARNGWTYLSDDATHLVRERAGYTVVGRPHRIRFRDSARRLFPELDRFMPMRRPNGKLDLEIETERLGFAIAYESQAGHLVFLNRQPGARTADLRPFPRSEAWSVLEQVVCHGAERTRTEQKNALRRLLDLPAVELTYGDAGEAEAALRSLVSGGGDR
jgi:hypothetical protein